MKFNFKSLILLIVIIALVIAGATYVNYIMKQSNEATLGEVYDYIDSNRVTSLKLDKKLILSINVIMIFLGI